MASLSTYSFSEPLGLTLGSNCALETVESDLLWRTIWYKTAKTIIGKSILQNQGFKFGIAEDRHLLFYIK